MLVCHWRRQPLLLTEQEKNPTRNNRLDVDGGITGSAVLPLSLYNHHACLKVPFYGMPFFLFMEWLLVLLKFMLESGSH